ncbi:hypothetical protein [Polyangium spumosum]|uniref:Uncharacterized protein n=1 Tax=Polyangium spumosum TaxID=889282 RepID=A0A6N7PRU2_9BACT|nr:hypothetical protein [Polyangium spumosum]MRG93546.1 hypothetical protein [Polyangium spumosum]
MRLPFRLSWFVLFATAGPALLGCAESDDEAPAVTPWSPPVEEAPKTQLLFTNEGTLNLGMREQATITVRTEPPTSSEVWFVLLGDSLDATLDRVAAPMNAEGAATVQMRAPNKATSFTLRAWIKDGPAAELPVTVSGDGFATLEVVPTYKGKRDVTTWTVSVLPRSTCEAVAPLLPDDAPADIVMSAPASEPLFVEKAPVGPTLAVSVRAGRYAWGCATASGLIAGTTEKIKVNIIDKPIVVGKTDLDVSFVFTPAATPWGSMMTAAGKDLLQRFAPAGAEASTWLLDEMAARVSELDGALFADARAASGWDTITKDHLAAQPMTLRAAIEAFLAQGSSAPPGELTGRLTALTAVPGYGSFSPSRLGVVPADEAGMPGTHLVKIASEPGDNIATSAELFWLPTRYVGGVCKSVALEGAPEGTTMGDALATIAGCDALGQALGSFGACDATCLAGLCQEALTARWDAAQDGSAIQGKIGLVQIFAAAGAKVDDIAVPVSLQGSWVGSVTDGALVASIEKSPVTGALPALPEEMPPAPDPDPEPEPEPEVPSP